MSFVEASMASFTVEDCQKRVQNRFLLVQMVIKRVRQFRDGYEPLIKTDNKEIVTALREIAEVFAEQVQPARVAAVFAHDIRKSPHISDSDGTSGTYQNNSQT